MLRSNAIACIEHIGEKLGSKSVPYDKLWIRLREKGVTGADLQKGIGISRRTLARLRKNENVQMDTLERISRELGRSVTEIMGENPQAVQKSQKRDYTVASFFAGIGGFDIGFARNGFTTEYFCEINEFCNAILDRHWPDVRRAQDINDVDPEDIPDVDVWVGGFPCQDISVARGRLGRPGLLGERSGLFYRFAELVEKKKPPVVLLENVAGLLNSNAGRDFGVILEKMTSLGYAVSWRMMNTRYFGAPQSRNRVYVLCWKNEPAGAVTALFETKKVKKPEGERRGFITSGSPEGVYPIAPQTAYCLAATSGRHTGTDWSRTYVVCSEGVRRMTPIECERLQGFPDHWTLPASEREGASDDTDTLRYTALGNAVSVPVVEWIADRIKKALNTEWIGDFGFDEAQAHVPSFSGEKWNHAVLASRDFTDVEKSYKWKNSGIAIGRSVITATTPAAPANPTYSNFAELVEREPVHSRYYLSPNAAEGIIRRVTRAGRSLFPPLHEALETLVNKGGANRQVCVSG